MKEPLSFYILDHLIFNSMKSVITSLLLIISIDLAVAQNLRVEPPFWWQDMPTDQLQLMVYGENIGRYQAAIEDQEIVIQRQLSGDSPNYKFIYLTIGKGSPSSFDINFSFEGQTQVLTYNLRPRDEDESKNQGFNSSDVIYLLMPDRFANGDPDNDSVEGMLEKANRTDPNGRHGGDIKGISDHLDYIKDLGMTAVWLTPVFENDMTTAYGAYHGYAATDLYRIDRRYGSNEEFRSFVKNCHENGIKVIMDMIHNHIGDQHWWMKDLPTSDWVHSLEKYGTTNFRGVIQSDPYASEYDLDELQKGWFVPEMPDLNQKNPLLADYLIQNTLWWIEYSGIDGIRMDTYVYPYKDYMARWVEETLTAYPQFNIVGEAWVETVAHESYWQRDILGQNDGYDSKLPNVTDFQVQGAISKAMNEDFSWTGGLMQLYYVLSQDRLYSNPMENVIFLDNHDLERFYTQINEDKELFKMAYAYLMTTRGIPQVYYGTELMMANANTEGDSRKRADMPGGWAADKRSVFKESDRTDTEKEILNYVKALTTWRKGSTAIHEGDLKHFLPRDNVYVFFRHTKDDCVMVVMNKNTEPKNVDVTILQEILANYSAGRNVFTQQKIDLSTDFAVPPRTTSIFELEPITK